MKRLILYAPGVHAGGGAVLLKALLSASELPMLELILDTRSLSQIQVPVGVKTNWCSPSFISRLVAEFQLRRRVSADDIVLCFHGIPPLLPSQGCSVVFVQNRLNLEASFSLFHTGTWRAALKRLLFRISSKNADKFIVQTPTMGLAVQRCLGSAVPVKVLPFLDVTDIALKEEGATLNKCYDFIYVADGAAHKNHKALLSAWILLAQEGLRPSLVLTLGLRDQGLVNKIENVAKTNCLQIENVGTVSRERVYNLYRSTRALIFPSKVESFGIPLIEAAQFKLPIIASELDYVRDVCTPVETFNPDSPTSIARAIKRFFRVSSPLPPPRNANEFFKGLLDI